MRKTAANGTEAAPIYRDIGLPVAEALAAFHREAYAQVVEHLLPARRNGLLILRGTIGGSASIVDS